MATKGNTYRWTLEVEVSADLVADGFDFNAERIAQLEERLVPYAIPGSEVRVRVKRAPKAERVAAERGA